ncbi:hypothetical protein FX988_00237 [Paraglaciecola mesophila]|uniref:DUF3750 domain-containing protein n=1 Tax=Paraglaciecola mesophila TaxID=197222 RepID=A0A857JFR4_9ALTE|nr:DUF3750 domain-containing protein [Paraglaciecola mesophila]QHJ10028.1 hypothetical protein FX988_00237 [Paraglaciecola mesophila]
MKTLIIVTMLSLLSGCTQSDWRTASRESAGLALDPATDTQASIEIYAADAFSWRGWFAVHTWLAIKPENAPTYTVYEVVSWALSKNSPALTEYETITPDRYWYGAKPEKILSIEGPRATELIPKVLIAVNYYPWAHEYTLFPGPNSNTFPAWVGLQVPELELTMPFRAIGSGYAH